MGVSIPICAKHFSCLQDTPRGCFSLLRWGEAALIPPSPPPQCCWGAQGAEPPLVEPPEPRPTRVVSFTPRLWVDRPFCRRSARRLLPTRATPPVMLCRVGAAPGDAAGPVLCFRHPPTHGSSCRGTQLEALLRHHPRRISPSPVPLRRPRPLLCPRHGDLRRAGGSHPQQGAVRGSAGMG